MKPVILYLCVGSSQAKKKYFLDTMWLKVTIFMMYMQLSLMILYQDSLSCHKGTATCIVFNKIRFQLFPLVLYSPFLANLTIFVVPWFQVRHCRVFGGTELTGLVSVLDRINHWSVWTSQMVLFLSQVKVNCHTQNCKKYKYN